MVRRTLVLLVIEAIQAVLFAGLASAGTLGFIDISTRWILIVGRRATTTCADNRLMKEWTDGIPQNSMNLYVNAWYPNWLGGKKDRIDRFVRIDQTQNIQQ